MIKYLLFISILVAGVNGQAATLKSFWRNRQGVYHLKNKMAPLAQRDFLRALEDDPLNANPQLNLGLTYEANEEFDKAEHVYRGVRALVPKDSILHYQATFNLGSVLGQQKKLDEAVAAYQECLERTPDSLEIKTNIELLFKGAGGKDGKDGKNDKDNKDGKGKGQPKEDDKKDKRSNQEKREQSQGQEPEQKKSKPQPKPFDSQDMKQEDVKRILDEIKNQEQAIRANEYDHHAKEAPRGKDW